MGLSDSKEADEAELHGDGRSPAFGGLHQGRQVHSLLSNPDLIQEAFLPVWRRACGQLPDGAIGTEMEMVSAPKSSVLQVLLELVQDFEKSNGLMEEASPTASPELLHAEMADAVAAGLSSMESELLRMAKSPQDASQPALGLSLTARQLAGLVSTLPDSLTRAEAQHLFRTSLLAFQASLAVRSNDEEWRPLKLPAARAAADGQLPVSRERSSDSQSRTGLRSNCRADDLACPPSSGHLGLRAARRPHPALAAMPWLLHPCQPSSSSSSTALPSRHELEAENEQLERLTVLVHSSATEELAVVRRLEEELRQKSEAASAAGGGGSGDAPLAARLPGLSAQLSSSIDLRDADGTLYAALKEKEAVAAEEVARLEVEVQSRSTELAEREAEVTAQQKEVSKLISARAEDEAVIERFSREARDLAAAIRSCERKRATLQSEIASEESRSSALREAFEGRRARFATAETAARNAELSTMRAARRRAAAEAAAYQEASAVEEAQEARDEALWRSESRLETLVLELDELRRLRAEGAERHGPGRPSTASLQDTTNSKTTQYMPTKR
eukprot:TRINITY_DN23510_c0_g1_i3.p1 TRINITY_DN23510_c0_g1~~TRINITY_DN23510_c0_g1_i3.p1  ORF type:complete len:561 (+),score=162.40 TRINITY_DN23510_c0_g1_i3:150-1832(+)